MSLLDQLNLCGIHAGISSLAFLQQKELPGRIYNAQHSNKQQFQPPLIKTTAIKTKNNFDIQSLFKLESIKDSKINLNIALQIDKYKKIDRFTTLFSNKIRISAYEFWVRFQNLTKENQFRTQKELNRTKLISNFSDTYTGQDSKSKSILIIQKICLKKLSFIRMFALKTLWKSAKHNLQIDLLMSTIGHILNKYMQQMLRIFFYQIKVTSNIKIAISKSISLCNMPIPVQKFKIQFPLQSNELKTESNPYKNGVVYAQHREQPYENMVDNIHFFLDWERDTTAISILFSNVNQTQNQSSNKKIISIFQQIQQIKALTCQKNIQNKKRNALSAIKSNIFNNKTQDSRSAQKIKPYIAFEIPQFCIERLHNQQQIINQTQLRKAKAKNCYQFQNQLFHVISNPNGLLNSKNIKKIQITRKNASSIPFLTKNEDQQIDIFAKQKSVLERHKKSFLKEIQQSKQKIRKIVKKLGQFPEDSTQKKKKIKIKEKNKFRENTINKKISNDKPLIYQNYQKKQFKESNFKYLTSSKSKFHQLQQQNFQKCKLSYSKAKIKKEAKGQSSEKLSQIFAKSASQEKYHRLSKNIIDSYKTLVLIKKQQVFKQEKVSLRLSKNSIQKISSDKKAILSQKKKICPNRIII